MFTIKTLNAIAECGLNVFDNDNYQIDNDTENPDGIYFVALTCTQWNWTKM